MWYKDAIIYELHVKGYYDSNADGIGDFTGLIEKLDYLVDEISKIKGVYGGRLMGAGFGGSIISIVKKSEIDIITDINYINGLIIEPN